MVYAFPDQTTSYQIWKLLDHTSCGVAALKAVDLTFLLLLSHSHSPSFISLCVSLTASSLFYGKNTGLIDG